ncbi:MAG: GNAT family N-acetyltransferase [Actinomycetota bacterium]|nr:GNAT family N-acetyltransferase [Actinomycetota bacterium]
MAPERATIDDLEAIVSSLSEFWGQRDTSALHHPMFVHEFGDTTLVVHEPEERVIAYLFGFLTPARLGYVHLVGVREGHRRSGLGRGLYAHFESLARERGAVALKALAHPGNHASLAFHRSLGFSATETPDYGRRGETRVIFRRELAGA